MEWCLLRPLLLSRFSRVQLCVTPWTAAHISSLSHQLFVTPPSLLSSFHIRTWLLGRPCCCWAASVVSDSVRPHRRQPTRLPIPGILQARTLEWVAISFSNAWKWKGKVKLLSRVWLLATPWTAAYQAPLSMGFSRQEYWSGLPLPSPMDLCWQSDVFAF